jgi:hypothetical protein
MLQNGPTFNHVLVNNVARLPKKFEFKIRKNENSLPTAEIFPNSPYKAVGKEGSSPTAW